MWTLNSLLILKDLGMVSSAPITIATRFLLPTTFGAHALDLDNFQLFYVGKFQSSDLRKQQSQLSSRSCPFHLQ